MMISQAGAVGPVATLTVDFRAPRDKLFRTWTEPDLLRKWFYAEDGMESFLAEMDLRPLGAWKLGIRPLSREGETIIYGHFIEVKPGERLAYTWTGACAREQYWTLVNARFLDQGAGSRLELTHGVFADDADRAAHEAGWFGCLGQLERFLGE
jgi:uncharacterized protein YndB with AHSA1/START domain